LPASPPCTTLDHVDILVRIKRLVVRESVRFAEKARLELEADGLEPEDALEAILNNDPLCCRTAATPPLPLPWLAPGEGMCTVGVAIPSAVQERGAHPPPRLADGIS
jgi:hypothetical protein